VKLLVLIMLVTLTACMSINPTPFQGPNGKQGYSMRCSGMGRTLDACYQKAGELCPTGYTIIHSTTGVVMVDDIAKPRNTIAIECK